MAYCMYCGTRLEENARFCTSCGAAVTQETVSAAAESSTAVTLPGSGYSVMLVDLGRCSASAAADLISDTCGYGDAESLQLTASVPTWVAHSLTKQQAAYLSQCLTEYGMEVSIFDSEGNKTLSSDVDTVFDLSGSLISKVAAVLGRIGLGNRITGGIRRLLLPSRPKIYTPPRPVAPPPVRRHEIRHVSPQPVRRVQSAKIPPEGAHRTPGMPRPVQKQHPAQHRPGNGGHPRTGNGGPQHHGGEPRPR